MILINLFFGLYFFSLVMFCLVSHPVYYCGLLVVNSFLCSLISYSVFGFSWYSLLFCLIYIGGVYILFIFVSVYSPNNSYVLWLNFGSFGCFLFLFIVLILGCFFVFSIIYIEFSSFLCNLCEGNFYVFMCLTLLFGFLVLSLIMCVKLNYYR